MFFSREGNACEAGDRNVCATFIAAQKHAPGAECCRLRRKIAALPWRTIEVAARQLRASGRFQMRV
jgi:hypothetical protein